MVNKKIIIDGLLVNYYQSDELNENPLVFLHGWGVDVRSMETVWKNYNNFIAIDWPGFGGSQIPLSVWNVDRYADFLQKILAELKIINPVLIGHSFGGRVIIKYCARSLGPVKRVILIDSAGIKYRSWKAEFLSRLSSGGKVLKNVPLVGDVVKKVGQKMQSDDYKRAGKNKETFKKVIGEDLQEDMIKMKVPAVIIWGENDKETPVADGKIMHKLIVGSVFYQINDAGHYPFVDKFEDFMKVFAKEIKC